MQSKKRKLMNSIFILHPWGFVIFLLLGTGLFIFTATKIQIPVYTTVETVVGSEDGIIRLDLGQREFQEGTPAISCLVPEKYILIYRQGRFLCFGIS